MRTFNKHGLTQQKLILTDPKRIALITIIVCEKTNLNLLYHNLFGCFPIVDVTFHRRLTILALFLVQYLQ